MIRHLDLQLSREVAMNIRAFAILFAVSVIGSPAHAQSAAAAAGGASSGASAANGSSSSSAAASTNAASSSTPIPGTTNGSTISSALQSAPGTPNTQPNTYKALSRGSSADEMGMIGGSGRDHNNDVGNIGPGNAVLDSSASNLSSTTNVGVMAPASNSSVQPTNR